MAAEGNNQERIKAFLATQPTLTEEQRQTSSFQNGQLLGRDGRPPIRIPGYENDFGFDFQEKQKPKGLRTIGNLTVHGFAAGLGVFLATRGVDVGGLELQVVTVEAGWKGYEEGATPFSYDPHKSLKGSLGFLKDYKDPYSLKFDQLRGLDPVSPEPTDEQRELIALLIGEGRKIAGLVRGRRMLDQIGGQVPFNEIISKYTDSTPQIPYPKSISEYLSNLKGIEPIDRQSNADSEGLLENLKGRYHGIFEEKGKDIIKKHPWLSEEEGSDLK